mmetsp:Transcript_32541/g.66282  ORF Transcript_32541/g.66282 Transcript_32541/m.66282 type:complete len:223 (+) Transcript_32541:7849-8517(+)
MLQRIILLTRWDHDTQRLQRRRRILPRTTSKPPKIRWFLLLPLLRLVLIIIDILIRTRLIGICLGKEPPLLLRAHRTPKQCECFPCNSPLLLLLLWIIHIDGNMMNILHIPSRIHIPILQNSPRIKLIPSIHPRRPSSRDNIRTRWRLMNLTIFNKFPHLFPPKQPQGQTLTSNKFQCQLPPKFMMFMNRHGVCRVIIVGFRIGNTLVGSSQRLPNFVNGIG